MKKEDAFKVTLVKTAGRTEVEVTVMGNTSAILEAFVQTINDVANTAPTQEIKIKLLAKAGRMIDELGKEAITEAVKAMGGED